MDWFATSTQLALDSFVTSVNYSAQSALKLFSFNVTVEDTLNNFVGFVLATSNLLAPAIGITAIFVVIVAVLVILGAFSNVDIPSVVLVELTQLKKT
jgi:hypothetical protein